MERNICFQLNKLINETLKNLTVLRLVRFLETTDLTPYQSKVQYMTLVQLLNRP